jgi:hypothetical protein
LTTRPLGVSATGPPLSVLERIGLWLRELLVEGDDEDGRRRVGTIRMAQVKTASNLDGGELHPVLQQKDLRTGRQVKPKAVGVAAEKHGRKGQWYDGCTVVTPLWESHCCPWCAQHCAGYGCYPSMPDPLGV